MAAPADDVTPLASDLRVVLGRMIRRLRAEHRFPMTQGAVLGRLDREGEQSIGALAHAEKVRPQSMSQTLSDLEAEGLVVRQPDATDGRRTLVALTDRGRTALEEDRAVRVGWLAGALAEGFTAEERAVLAQAVVLLDRLSEL